MLREELRTDLEKELVRQAEVFAELKELEPVLAEFPSVFDLVNALRNPAAQKEWWENMVVRLISLYRTRKGRGRRPSQQVILGILLLVFWEDMERLTEEEYDRLWRIDDEPFSEVSFAYTRLIAEGKAGPRLIQGESIKTIIYDEAKKLIKEKYKKQCVYEI